MRIKFLLLFSFFTLYTKQNTFLVFGGKTGWIGQKIVNNLESLGYQVHCADSRLENRESIEIELKNINPDFVINAAGKTGNPNVDWCEDNKQETIRVNIIGTLNLADICFQKGIHLTNLGTGCIYEYDEKHPMYSGIGFTEEDKPNFFGSFYSSTKVMLEKLLMCYPNVLNLRLRMPISSDFHPRNFITKITRYKKVINIPNSVTILDDLLPLIPKMCLKKITGIYNFVNPGVVSHNEILEIYKEKIDPSFTHSNFSVEEQDKILKARRSNNELGVSKLLNIFPDIPNAKDSLQNVFKKMKDTKVKSTDVLILIKRSVLL